MTLRPFIDTPFGTTTDAMSYLQMSERTFRKYQAQGIIKRLARNLYHKRDLDAVYDRLTKANTINFQDHESATEKGRTVDCSSHRSYNREKEEFLWEVRGGSLEEGA